MEKTITITLFPDKVPTVNFSTFLTGQEYNLAVKELGKARRRMHTKALLNKLHHEAAKRALEEKKKQEELRAEGSLPSMTTDKKDIVSLSK